MSINRKNIYHQGKKMIKDLAIKDKIEETFKVHPAYGHRRLALELKMNKKKTFYIVAETFRFPFSQTMAN